MNNEQLEPQWPMTTTFGVSGGLNVALAALGYMWLQKPYARKLYVMTADYSIS